jgi:hypothetical protein
MRLMPDAARAVLMKLIAGCYKAISNNALNQHRWLSEATYTCLQQALLDLNAA